MQIRVVHDIGDLANDAANVARKARPELAKIARRNIREGGLLTQRIARDASGIHGLNYWKRISSEMLTPLSGEWGPHGEVRENAVGAGWRFGAANTDLERSLDVIGPRAAQDVQDLAARLFW